MVEKENVGTLLGGGATGAEMSWLTENESRNVGRGGASGDGAHLVGGGRDSMGQLLTQLKMLGITPQIHRNELTILFW